jgi:hypothetical protein
VSLLNFFWGCRRGVVFADGGVDGGSQIAAVFLGAVALFLVLLALAMRNLPFPSGGNARGNRLPGERLAKSPATLWLFARSSFCIRERKRRWADGSAPMFRGWDPRGAAMASDDAGVLLVGADAGPGSGNRVSASLSERRVLRAGYAAGAAGIGLMLWAPSLPGSDRGALITGLSFATLYPITVARLSQRFGVAARSIGAVMFSLAAVGPAVLPWMVGVISHATGSLRAGLLLPLAATVILCELCSTWPSSTG